MGRRFTPLHALSLRGRDIMIVGSFCRIGNISKQSELSACRMT